MGLAERLAAGLRCAALGLTAGALAGVLDGAFAVFARPEAGALPDRLGTLAGAGALLAALGALAGAALGAAVGGSPRGGLRLAAAVAALAAVGAVAAALASAPEPPAAAPQDPPLNLLLVVVDTLRADHLEAYGYARDTAPNLSRLAREGVLFEAAFSPSAWTLPAHASLFTGLDAPSHGVEGMEDALTDAHATLAEALSADGYWTAAWVGTPSYGYAGNRYGLGAGFSHYRHAPHPHRFLEGPIVDRLRRFASRHLLPGALDPRVGGARAQVDAISAWLRAARREPFFLFVNFYDVHSRPDGLPYEAPAPYRDRFCPGSADRLARCRGGLCATDLLHAMESGKVARYSGEEIEVLRCLYDGAVAYVDAELGRLLAQIEREGLSERTVVAVTSDHGEGFFEHGAPLHVTLHDEILRVPLVFRVPGGVAGRRVQQPVSLTDVMPTLLELAGSAPPVGVQGRSLAPVLASWNATPDPAIPLSTRGASAALRAGAFKLIEQHGEHDVAWELYRIDRDPEERLDLAGREPARLAELRTALDAERARAAERRVRLLGPGTAPKVGISPEEREQLRALGYLDPPPAPGAP